MVNPHHINLIPAAASRRAYFSLYALLIFPFFFMHITFTLWHRGNVTRVWAKRQSTGKKEVLSLKLFQGRERRSKSTLAVTCVREIIFSLTHSFYLLHILTWASLHAFTSRVSRATFNLSTRDKILNVTKFISGKLVTTGIFSTIYIYILMIMKIQRVTNCCHVSHYTWWSSEITLSRDSHIFIFCLFFHSYDSSLTHRWIRWIVFRFFKCH